MSLLEYPNDAWASWELVRVSDVVFRLNPQFIDSLAKENVNCATLTLLKPVVNLDCSSD